MVLDPLTTLTAVATVFKIIDSISGQLSRFSKKKPDPEEEPVHSVLAKQEGDRILVRQHGNVVATITTEDLDKLNSDNRDLVDTLEKSMRGKFRLWKTLYPQRDKSPDLLQNAQLDDELDKLAKEFCADLKKIFRFLDQIGVHLEDHYSDVRFVCDELESN